MRERTLLGVVLLGVVLGAACASRDNVERGPIAGGGGNAGSSAGRGGTAGDGGVSGGARGGGTPGGAGGRGGTGGAEASSGRGGTTSAAGRGAGGASVGGRAPVGGASASSGAPAAGRGESGAGGEAGQGAVEPDYWRPVAGLSWQWQLSEELGEPLDVKVYDIDWEAPASDVEALHAAGIFVICYVSVGSWEDFRPDAGDFPDDVIGEDYDGWPGEKYLDIRADAARQIMLERFDQCAAKGFDAIEPDNMDVFELGSDSGFPLTRADGVAYARFLADAAHARGLGIGQKNASSLTDAIHADYDWALTESCYSDGRWCDEVSAYVDENKPVFMCEYEADSFADACDFGLPLHYSPILKSMDLDASVEFCP